MSSDIAWYYRPWVVLAMLFLVLGPLGLPFLFRSPAFNRPWKIILTVAVVAYTVFLVAGSWHIIWRTVEILVPLIYETR